MNKDIESTLSVLFSWIILTPISIIISGKIVALMINLPVIGEQNFKINLGILVIEAKHGEVILGFTLFIMFFALIGFFQGENTYLMVKASFGIDPGQFNALCMVSSFATVVLVGVIFFLNNILKSKNTISNNIHQEHNNLIDSLSENKE